MDSWPLGYPPPPVKAKGPAYIGRSLAVEEDVEGDVEVELTTFGRESRGIYDFWTRESWNL